MVNLLEKLNYTRTTLIQGKDAEGREEGEKLSINHFAAALVVCDTRVCMLVPKSPDSQTHIIATGVVEYIFRRPQRKS
jgi:hypothetical protein